MKNQAKEDYFYGENGELEDALSNLESQSTPCIKEILSTHSLPNPLSQEYSKLLTFIIIMATRTKDFAEQLKESTDKIVREFMSYDDNLNGNLDDLRVYPAEPAAMAISTAMENLHLAFDLKIKLLINKTPLKLITSDNPVVKYNQFLEQRKHPGGNVGIATKGLQIFFPISPYVMLCLYDEWVYKIGNKSNSRIELTNIDDIEKLNYLQVLNCYDHLYFNHEINENYIRKLFSKAKKDRLSEYSTLNKINSYIDNEGLEHIQYHSFNHNFEIGLHLSFIGQTKKAKKHVLSDYVVQLRNPHK